MKVKEVLSAINLIDEDKLVSQKIQIQFEKILEFDEKKYVEEIPEIKKEKHPLLDLYISTQVDLLEDRYA